jgi:hypothetical protein
MTFTYVGPATSDRDKVRFLIQDTDSTAPLLTDEEIAWLISEWADVYDAAANGCDVLANQYAHKADYSKSVGDLSLHETFSRQTTRFSELASNLRRNRMRRYAPHWKANADALKSTADRNVATYNTDAHLGQMDNPRSDTQPTNNQ